MKLITNIYQLLVTGEYDKPLCGKEMGAMPYIENAYLVIDEDCIYEYGIMDDLHPIAVDEVIDATGQIVLPMWCDSHTHLVFATTREDEFVDRIKGLSYQEIAAKGGGILNSARKLQAMSEDELYKDALERLSQCIKTGTGAIEIKTGYGLTVASELKMLRVIKRLSTAVDIPVKATLLAAHAIPERHKQNRAAYIDEIVNEMIPAFTKESLVDFIDIFCETGYFTVAEMDTIVNAGKAHGLKPKVHVNQFTSIGGIQKAIELEALTVDHLEELTEKDIDELKTSNTIPVALPGCSFFLNIPYTPARKIIDSGLSLAVATDYNPGSSPSSSMNFIVSQACINLKMTPAEAIVAATINGAFAMDVAKETGSITKGKKANLIITKPLPSYNAIPYHFGQHQIDEVIVNGEVL
ncbi:imidazolonepropionase [Dokdonia donghaensis]|uniref:Imidazolonepropionase n=1 Tax=Dokdonia donghaensis DSW-1 TaxID=1300343 RepID=A0A0A2GYM8_9FLAO|nr:imidazolonepropionase [Dokdonia donghaensis]ANH61250.1 Imidazolonepropionase [Dokdonia donghaensis DSW-1]KGO05550.1 imidazolonepropionase [Dokdonia donghaensis DSW-1]